MLTELLKLLNNGGLVAMDDAARRLGVSEALVADMADGLARRGYLAPLRFCGDAWSGCAAASMCGAASGCRPQARVLALTEKGRRAATTARSAQPGR